MLLLIQENLRQLCVFKLANESNVPWKWWEYVTKFGDECKMSENQYNEECAERVSHHAHMFGMSIHVSASAVRTLALCIPFAAKGGHLGKEDKTRECISLGVLWVA